MSDRPAGSSSSWTSFHNGFKSANIHVPEIYFFGIIDILQTYNVKKRVEHFVKSFTDDKCVLSTLNTVSYAFVY